ncbi:MAG: Alpha/Beta hydrolase protein [Lentinula lateritia]|nr:MAG: Alpha/Beta hydrolase protein [Lentinula lateritia]
MDTPPVLTSKIHNYTFAYYDSGPIQGSYITLVVVHGNTYHAGTFLSLFPAASKFQFRVILVQRRLYPGSTSYTEDETSIILEGTDEERKKVLDLDGELLSQFVVNMVNEHNLDKVAVIGWSAGTCYLNAIIDSIRRLDQKSQEQLQKHVHALIHWDPPASVMGLDDPPTGGWLPLYDLTLSPEQRGEEFGKWLSYHYPHPDLDKRDPNNLIYKLEAPIKTPSFSNISISQLLSMVDFSANPRGDSAVGGPFYRPILFDRQRRALFDVQVRKLWKNAKFCCIYGDHSPWNVQWTVWCFEKQIKEEGNKDIDIHFRAMKGANHFVMSDDPELILGTVQSLMI